MNNTGCGCQSYGGYNNGFLVILILFILLYNLLRRYKFMHYSKLLKNTIKTSSSDVKQILKLIIRK